MLLQKLYLGILHYRLVCTLRVYMKQMTDFVIWFFWYEELEFKYFHFDHMASDGHPKVQLKYST